MYLYIFIIRENNDQYPLRNTKHKNNKQTKQKAARLLVIDSKWKQSTMMPSLFLFIDEIKIYPNLSHILTDKWRLFN